MGSFGSSPALSSWALFPLPGEGLRSLPSWEGLCSALLCSQSLNSHPPWRHWRNPKKHPPHSCHPDSPARPKLRDQQQPPHCPQTSLQPPLAVGSSQTPVLLQARGLRLSALGRTGCPRTTFVSIRFLGNSWIQFSWGTPTARPGHQPALRSRA